MEIEFVIGCFVAAVGIIILAAAMGEIADGKLNIRK